MELFLKVYFVLASIDVVLRCLAIEKNDYPRMIYRDEDAITLTLLVGFWLWASLLIF